MEVAPVHQQHQHQSSSSAHWLVLLAGLVLVVIPRHGRMRFTAQGRAGSLGLLRRVRHAMLGVHNVRIYMSPYP